VQVHRTVDRGCNDTFELICRCDDLNSGLASEFWDRPNGLFRRNAKRPYLRPRDAPTRENERGSSATQRGLEQPAHVIAPQTVRSPMQTFEN
jgi:hypothetical protein